jgi:hypothetical protein
VSTNQHLKAGLVLTAAICAIGPAARADYVVLRSGARLNVTGYEILGDRYRLHLKGGVAEVPVDDIVGIEPEEVFEPIQEPLSDKTPFQKVIRAAAERYREDSLPWCTLALLTLIDISGLAGRYGPRNIWWWAGCGTPGGCCP